jgi:dienelactone hydrolase
MPRFVTASLAVALLACLVVQTNVRADAPHPVQMIRADRSLLEAPRYEPAKDLAPGEAGVRAIFYDAKPYQGKPTKTFAYLGVPKHPAGERVPAMVLVHGGGGTAFPEWVKLWNDRGYAAIAMDTCGAIPVRSTDFPQNKQWRRHAAGGPSGWDDSFTQMAAPVTDQWQYHALADILLAHSLIRSLPDVDPERVGLTGISWGGYLTSLAVGVDSRFKFAVPVYGCGFIDECVWSPTLAKLPPDQRQRWLDQWDPRHYLKDAETPMLWVTGTNDFAYPFPALQKSYRLPKGPRTLSVTLRMPHGHPPGQTPAIIHAYADSFLKPASAIPLPAITGQGRDGPTNTAWTIVASKSAIAKAELLFTRDTGTWQKRAWQAVAAKVEDGKAYAVLPEGARVYYLNLTDERGLTVSTEHEELP